MTSVSDYQTAFREHAAAHSAASDMVRELDAISSALNHSLRSFMGWQFNMRIDNKHEPYNARSRVDLAKWPSAEQLKVALEAWNNADTALRQAWDTLSTDERIGLTAPPTTVALARS